MINTISPRQRWLRRFRTVESPAERLICFPHAGGAASAFRTWPDRDLGRTELLAIQYPGRQDRVEEPFIRDMQEMVEALASLLTPLLDLPIAFFGHSMGAAIAYETAVELERSQGVTVRLLGVSSREAPDNLERRSLHKQGDEALVEDIKRLGGFDPEVFEVPEIQALVQPTVRADYQLIETYMPTQHKLRTPIAAYAGSSETKLLASPMDSWAHFTEREFTLKIFDGDHFYLRQNEDRLVRDFVEKLRD